MSKKNNLALLTLIIGVLVSTFSINIFAQKTDSVKNEQPQKSVGKKDALQNYIDISSLPMNKKQEAFRNLSNEDKANIFKLHLALQFIKRPNLNKDQKDIILESIVGITPDSYDRTKNRANTENFAQTLQARATALFSQSEVVDIFASLGGSQNDIELLRNYQSITSFNTRSDRREAFGKVSSENKSNFWKVQLIMTLTKISDLTFEQKDLILETIQSLNPELYQSKNLTELEFKQQKLTPLMEKVMKAFPDEIGIPIFSIIGGDEIDPVESSARCHCLQDSWFSGCGYGSRCSGGTCDDSPGNGTHCGFLGLWSCDGRCG